MSSSFIGTKTLSVRKTGTVLIVALWTLSLLSVFAVYLGVNVRQKIIFHSRLEQRSLLSGLAESGIKKAIALLIDYESKKRAGLIEKRFHLADKQFFSNNEKEFKEIFLGKGVVEISYDVFDDPNIGGQTYYGLKGEESKININVADEKTLERLIVFIMGYEEKMSRSVASAIIDWRTFGENEMVGFYSDAYYENLQYPYPQKNRKFEIIEELLLVKGMTKKLFLKLKPYITIYGRGGIDFNGADKAVLTALGFNKDDVEQILRLRRGPDSLEGTEDDFLFQRENLSAAGLQELIHFRDIKKLQEVFQKHRFRTSSSIYCIRAIGKIPLKKETQVITCVFDVKRSKIIYWRES